MYGTCTAPWVEREGERRSSGHCGCRGLLLESHGYGLAWHDPGVTEDTQGGVGRSARECEEADTDWVQIRRGLLRIAEVASRFTNRNSFIAMIEDMGFKLSSKDESNTHFITFDFEAAEVNEDVDLEEMRKHSNNLLKPCLYKKR